MKIEDDVRIREKTKKIAVEFGEIENEPQSGHKGSERMKYQSAALASVPLKN